MPPWYKDDVCDGCNSLITFRLHVKNGKGIGGYCDKIEKGEKCER